MKPNKVVMVAPEFYPQTMVGGLAMAVSGLAKALQSTGTEVHVVIPAYYNEWNSKSFNKEPFYKPSNSFGQSQKFSVAHSVVDGINLHHVDCANLGLPFAKPETYSLDYSPRVTDLARRQAAENLFKSGLVFSSTIPRALEESGLKDVGLIHLHEWMTAGASYWLRQNPAFSGKPILLTIHNANYSGTFPVPKELPRKEPLFSWVVKDSPYNQMTEGNSLVVDGNPFSSLLEFGLFYADLVNTVSPSEAQEVLAGRSGVDPKIIEVLRKKGLEGILNGLDHAVMNPKTDPAITQYDPLDFESLSQGKKVNKGRLQEVINSYKSNTWGEKCEKIQINPDCFLVSMMARLTEQKSIDEVIQAAEQIKQMEGVQLLVMGEPCSYDIGEKVKKLSGNAYCYPRFSGAPLQHLVLGASDAILAVSREEPCGYTPMEGMRYGCAPIVTMVGGHRDYIRVFDGENGFGFVVTPEPSQIAKSIDQTNKAFQNKDIWKQITRNAASEDLSWQGPRDSLGKYLELYSRVTKE